jgi:exopolyphosphatase/guanosine-5'-triphosphate,3'-diphosphate pyrophosphatase
LVAGALVAEAAMRALRVRELMICPWALREGVILRRLDTFGAVAGVQRPWPLTDGDGRNVAPLPKRARGRR